jgi:hypothetical protein
MKARHFGTEKSAQKWSSAMLWMSILLRVQQKKPDMAIPHFVYPDDFCTF